MVLIHSYMFGEYAYVFVSKKIIESVGFSGENVQTRVAVMTEFSDFAKFISFDP